MLQNLKNWCSQRSPNSVGQEHDFAISILDGLSSIKIPPALAEKSTMDLVHADGFLRNIDGSGSKGLD